MKLGEQVVLCSGAATWDGAQPGAPVTQTWQQLRGSQRKIQDRARDAQLLG